VNEYSKFEKALALYQGTEFNVDDEQLSSILAAVKRNNMNNNPSYSYVRKVMKTLGMNEYDSVPYVCHRLWGRELPDLRPYMRRMTEQFYKAQNILEKVWRQSPNIRQSLNINFRIYEHARLAGYECSKDDFKLPHTHDSVYYHNKVWYIVCDILGWKQYVI
jgi:hypothetical protein